MNTLISQFARTACTIFGYCTLLIVTEQSSFWEDSSCSSSFSSSSSCIDWIFEAAEFCEEFDLLCWSSLRTRGELVEETEGRGCDEEDGIDWGCETEEVIDCESEEAATEVSDWEEEEGLDLLFFPFLPRPRFGGIWRDGMKENKNKSKY